jgi:UDP-glucose 4-epimerase
VNLGSGRGFSVREVLEAVRTVTRRDVPVKEVGRRAGDPPVLVASNERAASVLGWQPARNLDRMIADAWEFHSAKP